MGRLCNARGARGAGRCGETRLQPIEEVAAAIAVEAKIGVARVPSLNWGTICRRRGARATIGVQSLAGNHRYEIWIEVEILR